MAQFPAGSHDSLINYTNRFIDNDSRKAFTNLRLNILLRGVIDYATFIGTGGNLNLGMDTAFMFNDSLFMYRKSGIFHQFIIRGANAAASGAGNIYRIPFNNGLGQFKNDSNFLFDQSVGPDASRLIVGPFVPSSGGYAKINATSDNMNALALTSYGTGLNTMIFRRAHGTFSSPTGLLSGDDIFNLSGRGYGNSAFSTTSRASIYARATQGWTDSTQGTSITLATTPNDSISLKTGLTLDHNGDVYFNQYPNKVRLTDTNAIKPVGIDTLTGKIIPIENWPGLSPSWCSPLQSGADATGVLDASAVIQNLINSGCKVIYMPSGTYLFNNTVQMKDSVTILGDGRKTIIKLNSNIPAFKCSWSMGGNKSQFKNISFIGNRGTGTTSQEGILVDSVNGVYISNIGAYKLSGFAVRFRNQGFCCGGYPLPTGVLGGTISDIWVDSCYGGVKLDSVGEYIGINNSIVVKSVYGIYVAGGNARINNNNLSGNTYGLYLTGGSNNGHGAASNNTINHNDYNVYLTGVSLGFSFMGNMCYASNVQNIHLDNCDIVKFYGGSIAGSVINYATSTNTLFSDVRIASTFSGSGEAPTVIENGKINKGVGFNDVANSKIFYLLHDNGIVNLNGDITRIRSLADTINFTHSGSNHVLAGGENSADSLRLTSTTHATKGKILFGKSAFSENANLLGIGTISPAASIDVRTNTNAGDGLEITNTSTGSSSGSRLLFWNETRTQIAQFLLGNSNNVFSANGLIISVSAGKASLISNSDDITFGKSTSIGSNEHARFKNNGNLLIGAQTDNGYKTQIYGSAYVRDSLKVDNMPTGSTSDSLLVARNNVVYKIAPSMLKASTTWDPPSISANSSNSTTITVTGASLGDPVTISKVSGSYSNGEVYFAYVSSANTVTIQLQNTSGGSFDISSDTFNVIVIKY